MGKHGSGRKKQSAADKQAANAKPKDGVPKSMVIRIGAGEVGAAVSQLVTDVRHVMEPDTAVRLKVCRYQKCSPSCYILTLSYRNEEPTNSATM